MLFNSFSFIFLFLPLVLGISLKLKGTPLLFWIAMSSFAFYSLTGHAWFLIPMLITTCIDFFLAPYIAAAENKRKKAFLLAFSVIANLSLLFYFKYSKLLVHSHFLMEKFGLGSDPTMYPHWVRVTSELALPAGISFYTFQTISYVVDVWRGTAHPEKSFWKFASFVAFFPHLVAGPLTRHNQLIPGLTNISKTGIIAPNWREGIFLFVVGLSKKVLIADRFAAVADPILNDLNSLNFLSAWTALLCYTMQIYFDFSGYSDMAVGLGRLFGIELPKNFNSPYKASDPSDFWRRWHITLGAWLRDYLYIPLGGNRGSLFRTNFNLMTTMVLGGIWHGAHLTFAIWGFYHGSLLIIYHQFSKKWDKWPLVLRRASTFILITLGWVFFRSNNVDGAKHWFKYLINIKGLTLQSLGAYDVSTFLLLVGGLFAVNFLPNAVGFKKFETLPILVRITLAVVAIFDILFINFSSRFLYFQF